MYFPSFKKYFKKCSYLKIAFFSNFCPLYKPLLAVISLWLAKNKTTSLFSFLIGTISNRHQNGFWPEKRKQGVTFNFQLASIASCNKKWPKQIRSAPNIYIYIYNITLKGAELASATVTWH